MARPAVAGNNFTFPIGGRAGAMAGAYSAMSEDPSMAWYNPAALGFSDRSSLEVSGSAYSLEHAEIPEFIRTDLPSATYTRGLSATPFQVAASSLSYIYAVGKRAAAGEEDDQPQKLRHSIALSVFVPNAGNFSKSSVLNTEEPGGSYHQRFSLDMQANVYNIGLSWGMSFGRKLSIGLSLFGTYATAASHAAFNLEVESPGSMPNFIANANNYGVTEIGLAFVFGIQYRPTEHWRFGLVLRPPGLSIWRQTTGMNLNTEVIGTPSDASSSFYDLPIDRVDWLTQASPFGLTLGVAWITKGSFAISLDGDYTTLMDRGDYGRTSGYFNVRLGVEVFIVPQWILGFGGFTDLSSAPDLVADATYFGSSHIDFAGGTVGITYISPYLVVGSSKTNNITFSTTFGVKYAYGWGEIVGLNIDWAQGVSYDIKPLAVHDIAAFVASNISF